jgi:hypothetical protein
LTGGVDEATILQVALVGGTLTIDSTAREGTTVRISIPSRRVGSGEAAISA